MPELVRATMSETCSPQQRSPDLSPEAVIVRVSAATRAEDDRRIDPVERQFSPADLQVRDQGRGR